MKRFKLLAIAAGIGGAMLLTWAACETTYGSSMANAIFSRWPIKYGDYHLIESFSSVPQSQATYRHALLTSEKAVFFVTPGDPDYSQMQGSSRSFRWNKSSDHCYQFKEYFGGAVNTSYASLDEAIKNSSDQILVVSGSSCFTGDKMSYHEYDYKELVNSGADTLRSMGSCEQGRYGGCARDYIVLQQTFQRD